MFSKLFGKGGYAAEVEGILARELGRDNASTIANSTGGRKIISSYEGDGVSAEKAAVYILAKIKYSPKSREEEEILEQLVFQFQNHGIEFMALDPELHYAILHEAIVFNAPGRTVEMFCEIADRISQRDYTDQQAADALITIYRERDKLISPS